MEFIETRIFTRLVREYLDDERYRAFQLALLLRPELGALIPGSGGLRKARWAAVGHGKRGSLRIIYQWDARRSSILCLFIYQKNEQGDLTPSQLRQLRRLSSEEFQ